MPHLSKHDLERQNQSDRQALAQPREPNRWRLRRPPHPGAEHSDSHKLPAHHSTGRHLEDAEPGESVPRLRAGPLRLPPQHCAREPEELLTAQHPRNHQPRVRRPHLLARAADHPLLRQLAQHSARRLAHAQAGQL